MVKNELNEKELIQKIQKGINSNKNLRILREQYNSLIIKMSYKLSIYSSDYSKEDFIQDAFLTLYETVMSIRCNEIDKNFKIVNLFKNRLQMQIKKVIKNNLKNYDYIQLISRKDLKSNRTKLQIIKLNQKSLLKEYDNHDIKDWETCLENSEDTRDLDARSIILERCYVILDYMLANIKDKKLKSMLQSRIHEMTFKEYVDTEEDTYAPSLWYAYRKKFMSIFKGLLEKDPLYCKYSNEDFNSTEKDEEYRKEIWNKLFYGSYSTPLEEGV